MLLPPPCCGWLSIISTSKPAWRKKAEMPSGRLNGPEKRRSTVRDVRAGCCASGTSRGISLTRESGSLDGTAAGSPGGWS
eukprot:3772185-Pleurochrysis_carterae.AAC.1